jgi:hypothetical protein
MSSPLRASLNCVIAWMSAHPECTLISGYLLQPMMAAMFGNSFWFIVFLLVDVILLIISPMTVGNVFLSVFAICVTSLWCPAGLHASMTVWYRLVMLVIVALEKQVARTGNPTHITPTHDEHVNVVPQPDFHDVTPIADTTNRDGEEPAVASLTRYPSLPQLALPQLPLPQPLQVPVLTRDPSPGLTDTPQVRNDRPDN